MLGAGVRPITGSPGSCMSPDSSNWGLGAQLRCRVLPESKPPRTGLEQGAANLGQVEGPAGILGSAGRSLAGTTRLGRAVGGDRHFNRQKEGVAIA